jgi:glutathione peroxidase
MTYLSGVARQGDANPVVKVMTPRLKSALLAIVFGLGAPAYAGAVPGAARAPAPAAKGQTMSALDVTFTSISGAAMPLAAYKGSVILVVNTASKCGYTPQYKGLEALWDRYRARGLVVIGAPSNDFGGQEPGSEAEIKDFCELNFGVSFPLTAKVKTQGSGQHPFYAWSARALGEAGKPQWNFHKVLIGRDGAAIAGFSSRVRPDDPALVAAIEAAL